MSASPLAEKDSRIPACGASPPPRFGPYLRLLSAYRFRASSERAGRRDVLVESRSNRTRRHRVARASTELSAQEIEREREFGPGSLRIPDYRLTNLRGAGKAAFEWLRFEIELSWPARPAARP
jgi:hypothetical protein